MKEQVQSKTVILQNRYGGDELTLVVDRGFKHFTIDFGGVRLSLTADDLFDLIEMLNRVYKIVR